MVMKPEVKDRIMSHEHPVTAAVYNSKFNQVHLANEKFKEGCLICKCQTPQPRVINIDLLFRGVLQCRQNLISYLDVFSLRRSQISDAFNASNICFYQMFSPEG